MPSTWENAVPNALVLTSRSACTTKKGCIGFSCCLMDTRFLPNPHSPYSPCSQTSLGRLAPRQSPNHLQSKTAAHLEQHRAQHPRQRSLPPYTLPHRRRRNDIVFSASTRLASTYCFPSFRSMGRLDGALLECVVSNKVHSLAVRAIGVRAIGVRAISVIEIGVRAIGVLAFAVFAIAVFAFAFLQSVSLQS